MIGQQKRSLDLAASLPPAKCYKQFDESNNSSNKRVTTQASKHFSAAPVEMFCISLDQDQLKPFPSVSSPVNFVRRSGTLKSSGPGDWDGLYVGSKDRRGMLSDGEEVILKDCKQEARLCLQNPIAGNACVDDGKGISTVLAEDLPMGQSNSKNTCYPLNNRVHPEGGERPSLSIGVKEDPAYSISNSEELQDIELFQSSDLFSRKSMISTSSNELLLKEGCGVLGLQNASCYHTQTVSLKEYSVASNERKQEPPFQCLDDLHSPMQQTFDGITLEHVGKMGSQALWCPFSSSHSYATEQSGPGSVSHMASAEEEVEYEGHPVLGTPRKRVPVGSDFQAELPKLVFVNERSGIDSEKNASCSPRWLGEQIWPRQDSDSVDSEKAASRAVPATCSCAIRDAVECVRLHIEEQREVLKSELGGAFYAWGFDEMGEAVSENWTCEEELIFHELVRKNPLSEKKNFWYELFLAFPSRCMRELVSYYFNVFVLRRRAIQNRVVPWRIDSDDDEMALDSDDEDSASLFESDDDDDINESQVDDAVSEDGEVDDGSMSNTAEDTGDNENIQSSAGFGDSPCVAETTLITEDHVCAEESSRAVSTQDSAEESLNHSSDCSLVARNQGNTIQEMRSWEMLAWDQANHCPSNQAEVNSELPCVTYTTSDRQTVGDCSTCKEGFLVSSQQCMLDQCATKVWDASPLLSSQKDVDKLISTKGMMEEFFGAESWEGEK